MRPLLRLSIALVGSVLLAACGSDVVASGGGSTTTGSSSTSTTGTGTCPAPTPGQCTPSAECVGGTRRTGQASCVDGAWVCETVACGAGGAGGGCASRVLRASDYDTSCTEDEDCAPVFAGDACGSCFCDNAAIAKSALASYQADLEAAALGPSACDCAQPPPPVCENGTCKQP